MLPVVKLVVCARIRRDYPLILVRTPITPITLAPK